MLTDTPEFMKGASSLPKLDVFEFILMEEKLNIVLDDFILDKLRKDMKDQANCELSALILRTYILIYLKIPNLQNSINCSFSCIQDTSC